METSEITLFVFDTPENFEKSKQYLGSEGEAFKKIICIKDSLDFGKEFSNLNDEDKVFMVVHAFSTDKISGIKRFSGSGIRRKYENLGFMYISEGDSKDINKQMIDQDLGYNRVFKYWEVQEVLEAEKFPVYTKSEITRLANKQTKVLESKRGSERTEAEENYPQCDYAIITALEEDEMEQVLPFIVPEGSVENVKHLIHYGHFTSKPEKKVVYASQLATGMVDASILATELIIRFRPKFLIMTGVLGGKPNDTNIGDIVVSTRVFTIDKGKLSETEFERELEVANTDNSYTVAFRRSLTAIKRFLEDSHPTIKKGVNIHFGPVACVRSVVNKKGYFAESISIVERKTIALEMESYGIARACELVNDGRTIPLIIKSVMDNTHQKDDGAKTYAAWTSAMFLKYAIEHDLI